jgi:predicted NBD/HSP70 family sugar kinase
VSAGYLRESSLKEAGGRGRPSTVLAFNERHGLVLTADVGAAHARAMLSDLTGASLGETARTLHTTDDLQACLEWLQSAWRRLLREAEPGLPPVVGIGVGIPGPVDVRTGRPVRPPIMPGWHDHPVRERLEDAFGVPAFVENDANLMALGEFSVAAPDCPSLLFVKVATGIGAGMVVDGQLVRGVNGGSGDLGHVRLTSTDDGPVCVCGARGCLAASASGGAIARRLAEAGARAGTSREAMELAHRGDPLAVSLVRSSGLQIGEVLATAVSLINPGLLVVGGDVTQAQEHFMPALKERLYQRTQPLATHDLRVVTSELGDRAGVAGGVALVVEEIYSAGSVDRALAAGAG